MAEDIYGSYLIGVFKESSLGETQLQLIPPLEHMRRVLVEFWPIALSGGSTSSRRNGKGGMEALARTSCHT